MKKITLLLTMLLTMCYASATEGYKVVYVGEGSIDNWAYLDLDCSLLADAQVGDYIYVEGTQVTSNSWTQLQLITSKTDVWAEVSYEATASNELTSAAFEIEDEDMLTKLTTRKFSFKGDNLIINKVAYGKPVSTSLVSDATKLPFDTKEWDVDALQLSASVFATAKAGDKVVLTFSSTYTTEKRDYCQLSINQNYPWTEIYGNASLKDQTTAEFTLAEENLANLATNGACISGKGVVISAVNLVSNNYEYQLYAGKDNIDLTKVTGTVNVNLHRTFNWNTTLCLPFDVASVTTTFGSTAKAYEFKVYNNGLVFTEREHIEAGKPYFMEFGEADKDQTSITISDVTINTTLNNSAESEGLTFKGNYTPSFNMQGKYGIACVEESTDKWVWGFYKGGSGSTLNAFSAYFEGSIPSGEARLAIILDNETTGIATVKTNTAGNEYYTLSGQRVAQPTKGLYIVNGRKVVVK